MPKTILKKTRTAAVVKCSGAATHVITLATDLAVTGQTPSTPTVNIRRMEVSCPVTAATVKISRGGVLLWSFAGPAVHTFDFQGFTDSEGNTSDLSVVIAGEATVVISLAKVAGYGDTQHDAALIQL
jgi:hypothetical protein